ncbi:MAG: hypothetical protein QF371_08250, partial [Flavobacteriales bacterium]|nr:hypothetical protein [Flavobacteriales bacterium]
MPNITPSRKRIFTLVMVLLPVVIPLLIAETYLRIQGDLSTYSEKIGRGYESYYGQTFKDSLWRYEKDATVVTDHGEFSYTNHSNELGIFEKTTFIKDTDNLRIITLGDSFTEGIGAPYDSAWPRALEARISELLPKHRNVQVYNAGVSGSDPILNYMMLKK